MQLEGDGANSSHVRGNIFAGGAVAAGCRLHQHAVFIENAHREAVELKLAAVGKTICAFQAILYPLVEGEKALFVKHVIQRQHRHFMADLAKGGEWRRPHPLCWRIRGNQLRVLALQLAQLAHQAVIFRIRHFRRVHNVVQIFMMAKRGSQFSQLLFDWFHITPSMIKNPRQAGVEKGLS
ncbi:Uncharacterised protein [Klebsiella pneumoniae]|nr:Uncharacterised protein [Klebsiella pneumoniae]